MAAPDTDGEEPTANIDPMALLAALLNATGLLRVRKGPPRKPRKGPGD